MKSEHRHELKTNELAEWIANFPTWAKENAKVIIAGVALVVVIVAVYGWNRYNTNVVRYHQRIAFTSDLTNLATTKAQLAQQGEKADNMQLLFAADGLEKRANETKGEVMSALAYIKRAEALRAAVLIQPGELSQADITKHIENAQASYTKALDTAAGNKTLAAIAAYGLGLCAEELNDYKKAAEVYQGLVDDDTLAGTTARASAEYRLKTMDQYQNRIVFSEAPEPILTPTQEDVVDMSKMGPVPGLPVVDINAPEVMVESTDANASTN
jgi:hypothetical protein